MVAMRGRPCGATITRPRVDCACNQAAPSPTSTTDPKTVRRNAIGGTLLNARLAHSPLDPSERATARPETQAINCPNSNSPSNGRRRLPTTYCRIRLSNRGLVRKRVATLRLMREGHCSIVGQEIPQTAREERGEA